MTHLVFHGKEISLLRLEADPISGGSPPVFRLKSGKAMGPTAITGFCAPLVSRLCLPDEPMRGGSPPVLMVSGGSAIGPELMIGGFGSDANLH